jgi:hypothetical protein
MPVAAYDADGLESPVCVLASITVGKVLPVARKLIANHTTSLDVARVKVGLGSEATRTFHAIAINS